MNISVSLQKYLLIFGLLMNLAFIYEGIHERFSWASKIVGFNEIVGELMKTKKNPHFLQNFPKKQFFAQNKNYVYFCLTQLVYRKEDIMKIWYIKLFAGL